MGLFSHHLLESNPESVPRALQPGRLATLDPQLKAQPIILLLARENSENTQVSASCRGSHLTVRQGLLWAHPKRHRRWSKPASRRGKPLEGEKQNLTTGAHPGGIPPHHVQQHLPGQSWLCGYNATWRAVPQTKQNKAYDFLINPL